MKQASGHPATLTALLAIFLALIGCTGGKKPRPTRPVADVVPLTAANLRGHRMLYKEGWFIVTSTERSLAYAKHASLTASWQAIVQVAREVKAGSKQYVRNLGDNYKKSWNLAVQVLELGREATSGVFAGTHYLGKLQWQNANSLMVQALDAFVQGHLSLGTRTAGDRAALAALPGGYFNDLREDFSNLHELSRSLKRRISRGIRISWNRSFAQAAEEFRKEYEESGTRPNSFVALGDILTGWLKAFYHGLARPGARTIVRATARGLKYGVFLPAAAVLIVAGRTVQTTGLALYHVGSLGVDVISPTLEAGFLAALGLLSYGSVPVIYTSGTTLGAFSLASFSTLAPAAGTARAVGGTATATGQYVVGTFADVTAGTTKVVINQLKAGVVLGYNALVAIPAHLYLGSIDTAIFLAWDGPRLVIAMARGAVSFTGADGKPAKVSVGALPVGTVVDLKKLRKQKQVKVQVISEDPAVIRDVLRELPGDLRREDRDEPK